MTQGQDKALWVPLALPDQEHTLGRQSNFSRDPGCTCPSISLVPGSVPSPSPAPYPSTRPCCLISRWLSSREMRPWNQGWVRWMAGVRGEEVLVIQRRDCHPLGGPLSPAPAKMAQGSNKTHPGDSRPSPTCTEAGARGWGGQAEPVVCLLLQGGGGTDNTTGWESGCYGHPPSPQTLFLAPTP